jgi:MYXO-CTERM domain-containing protein
MRRPRHLVLVVLVVLAVAPALVALTAGDAAATTITGGNIINQTWTTAGSPYVIQGDITVPAGAYLHIDPGVVVQFASSDAQASGLNTSRVELTVHGTLEVNGTAGSHVTFTGQSASAGSWYGIVIGASATAATIQYADVSYAIYGVHSQNTGSALSVVGSSFTSCSSYGVHQAAGTVTYDGITAAQNSSYGIYVTGNAQATITSSVVRNNGSSGIVVGPSVSGKVTTITGTTINANNGHGVSSQASAGSCTLSVQNSIITNNQYGVVRGDASTVSVSFSDVWNNSFANYSGTISQGSGVISANPLYVSGTNLRLTSRSPARFGAMGGGDMGALPYTGDLTPNLVGTLWENTTLAAAGSPYMIPGDLTVAPGVTLTVQPGVTLAFAASDLMLAGANTGRAELRVEGSLVAAGTAGSPITFTGQSASAGSWYGVHLLPGAVSSTLDHVSILYGVYGLWWEATAASNGVARTTASSCSSYGFYVTGGAPVLDTVTAVSNSSYGIYLSGNAQVTVTGSVVRNNGSSGIVIGPTVAGKVSSVVGSTINANNGHGVSSQASAGSCTLSVQNSVITNNQYGVVRGDASTVSVSFSDVWNNSFANYSGTISQGSGVISSNPLYVSATNLRLTRNSPARFGAMGGGDMGALPYTTDPTPNLVGTLWDDTTLTAAGGPHMIPGDLTVAPGVTLTVEPGATLSFAASDLMLAGANTARAELRVEGALVAAGAAGSPITFTGQSSSAGSWYGVHLLPGGDVSTLDRVTVRYAVYGLWIDSTASHVIKRSTFRDSSSYGVYVTAGAPALDAIQSFSNSSYGVYLSGNAQMALSNAVVRNNGSSGVVVGPSVSGKVTTIVNSTINANNGHGVSSQASAGSCTLTITNAIVTNNQYGVVRGDASAVSIGHSDVWNNSFANFSGTVSQGAGMISANPQYVSATDLHLMSSSVCIDAGTTGSNHDLDDVTRPLDGDGINGVATDMGAYEFVLAAVCGNGALEPGETCDSGAQNGQYGACKADCSGLGPRCGDGATNGPEQCDDGNALNTDACLNTCQAASCGDGFTRTGTEQCDDGNASNTDACLDTCVNASCGDGFTRAGVETCDDGNVSNTDACLATCVAASCGDGFVQTGVEACDDMNGSNNDACLNTCQAASCGDGFTRTGVEQCDDGNMSNTDACVGACVAATCGDGFVQLGVEQCDDANMVDTDACRNGCVAATCGDGVVQVGVEQCDDGNLANTDACLNNCKGAVCGDGVTQTGVEQCDDGDLDNTDSCTASCTTAVCGDGFVHAGVEECDDDNLSNSDACLNSCVAAACGDGYVRTGVEACDDGNMIDNDGCSNACALPGCGDGVVQGSEACDDGNASNQDACLTSCIEASCGDGYVYTGVEICDDGNTDDGDGCSSLCEIELPPDAGPMDPDAGPGTPDAGPGDADAGAPDAGAGAPDAGDEPPPDDPPDDGGGCGCRAGGARAGSWPAAGLLLAVASVVLRRRRRPR